MKIKLSAPVVMVCLLLNVGLLLPFSTTTSIAAAPDIGDMAPEITLPDRNGQNFRLSSLKGNLVLVSFWSTWCVACNVVKNPEYVKLYDKYKLDQFTTADGFTILSVGFDSNIDKWKRRIQKNNLTWPFHVVDPASYDSPYWLIYELESIPANFLLDENGQILGRDMSFTQLDYELGQRSIGKRPYPVGMEPPPPPPPPIAERRPAPIYNPPPPQREVITAPPPPPVYNPPAPNPRYGEVITAPPPPVYNPPPPSTHYGEVITTPPPPPVYNPPTPNPRYGEVVTAPPPPPVYNSPTYGGDEGEVYKIQLGVFKNPAINQYNDLGHLGTIELENVPNKPGLSRVHLGSFGSKGHAEIILEDVKAAGFQDAFVVMRGATGKSNTLPTMPPTTNPPPQAPIANNNGGGNVQNGLDVFGSGSFDNPPPANSAPLTPPMPTFPSEPPSQSNGDVRLVYKIQLGVFADPPLAHFGYLESMGRLQTEAVKKRPHLQRLLLGDFEDKTTAEHVLTQVHASGHVDAFVIHREYYRTEDAARYNPSFVSNDVMIDKNGDLLLVSNPMGQKGSMVGRPAPEILTDAIAGPSIPLRALKGDVVLLYLWAPWSGLAREHHVEMNRIYRIFRNEPFEIFSVAFDKNKERIKRIMNADELLWKIHLYDEQGMESEILKHYNVDDLPALFLVNERGIVTLENVSYEELEDVIAKELGY